MISLAKPKTINDALDTIMLGTDPASPIPETDTPVPVEQVEKPVSRKAKTEKDSTLNGGILGELTSQIKQPRVKVTLNTRIDDFIDKAINKALRDLEEKGFTGITKESIVNLSLVRGLNLTPPDNWELL
jgi:hypothetical protein